MALVVHGTLVHLYILLNSLRYLVGAWLREINQLGFCLASYKLTLADSATASLPPKALTQAACSIMG